MFHLNWNNTFFSLINIANIILDEIGNHVAVIRWISIIALKCHETNPLKHIVYKEHNIFIWNSNCITLQKTHTLTKQKEIKSVIYNTVYYSLSTYLNIEHIVTITFQAVGHKPFTNFNCTLTQYCSWPKHSGVFKNHQMFRKYFTTRYFPDI